MPRRRLRRRNIAVQIAHVTCIDADDTFTGADALAILRRGLESSEHVKCCVGAFVMLERDGTEKELAEHPFSMDGKLYRRDFIDSYGIRFNGTRINEDYTPDSITHAGNGQFVWDQSDCSSATPIGARFRLKSPPSREWKQICRRISANESSRPLRKNNISSCRKDSCRRLIFGSF